MPRQPTCLCGVCPKCKHRERARMAYQAMSPDERRAWVARRDPERVRAADRERYRRPEAIARLTASTRRWREQHPEKYAAHIAVNNAIRKGMLVKQPCERCGATGRVHAHHDDYDKPLDVRWLCPLHHAEER